MELREIKEGRDWKIEIVEDGRSISRLWFGEYQMRIGSCAVKMGGIGGVGTDRKYRMQGLSRQVMEASVELMKREGYDTSFLYGIQDFYSKFGFATCMPERRLYLGTREGERAERMAKMRPMKKGDWAQVLRIYNRDNARRTASVVRDARIWGGFVMGSQFSVDAAVRVVVDDRDRVRGYVAYDDVEYRVRASEMGGEGEEVFSSILCFLARRAVKLRRQEISLSIPLDHPFALYCRQFGCRDSTHFGRNGGAMGRIINLLPFMEKVLPELALRWGTEDRDKRLGITTDIGSCVLQWQRGRLTLTAERLVGSQLRLKHDALLLLMMGYQTPDDLIATGKLKAPRRLFALLERLFPLQQAHMWWADRF